MIERHCNECTLCCRLLPVRELKKLANMRCQFQHAGKGCMVYHDGKHFPPSCGLWSCAWLAFPDTTMALARPDRSHYVIDPAPDFIEIDPNDGSESYRISALQIWVDPKFPHAHRDPALRAYLLERAERYQQLALIRYSSSEAFVLVPPSMSGEGEWVEQRSNCTMVQHSAAEIVDWELGNE